MEYAKRMMGMNNMPDISPDMLKKMSQQMGSMKDEDIERMKNMSQQQYFQNKAGGA